MIKNLVTYILLFLLPFTLSCYQRESFPVETESDNNIKELCDNLDNDNDGVIDSFYTQCETACGEGSKYCKNGTFTDCLYDGEICIENSKNNTCSNETQTNQCEEVCLDNDEDGYFINCNHENKDCNDNDNRINPQASEICDGLDNDCNSIIDDDEQASSACDDFLFCNGIEKCLSGLCVNDDAIICDNNNICTVGQCNEDIDSCVYSNIENGNQCDDGLFCTTEDHCLEGQCTGTLLNCEEYIDQCNIAFCFEESDSCISNPLPAGTVCDDNLSTTLNEICYQSQCIQPGANGNLLLWDQFPSDSGPVAIKVADLNNDKKNDVIVANRWSNSLDIFLGQLDSENTLVFSNLHNSYNTGEEPVALEISDVDNNGFLDIIVLNSGNNTFYLYLNQGNYEQHWQGIINTAEFNTGETPGCLLLSDINADNFMDIIVGHLSNRFIRIFMGNTDQESGTAIFKEPYDIMVNIQSASIKTADFNGDKIQDLAIAAANYNSVAIMTGKVNSNNEDIGSFNPPVFYDAGSKPSKIEIADLNSDSIPDLVVLNPINSTVSILKGNAQNNVGTGSFSLMTHYSIGEYPWDLAIADMNHDSLPDIIISDIMSKEMHILFSQGSNGQATGLFEESDSYSTTHAPFAFDITDIDHDGISDIVLTEFNENSIKIYKGDGILPKSTNLFETANIFDVCDWPSDITTADFNSDNVNDLAITCASSNNVIIMAGQGINGNSDGTFALAAEYDLDLGPKSIINLDIDNNGTKELIIANNYAGSITILSGNNNISNNEWFINQESIQVCAEPVSLTAVDLNQDGWKDIIVLCQSESVLAILTSDTIFNFNDPVIYQLEINPHSMSVADLNGDRINDIAIAGKDKDYFIILPGNGSTGRGDGTFGDSVIINHTASKFSLNTTDLDNNGITDLLSINQTDKTIKVFLASKVLELSESTLSPHVIIEFENVPIWFNTTDFNNDKFIDIAVIVNGEKRELMIFTSQPDENTANLVFILSAKIEINTDVEKFLTLDANADHLADLLLPMPSTDQLELILARGIYE